MCFNPCYSGSNSKIELPTALQRTTNIVSILVIVEVTLKSAHRSKDRGYVFCFNPCYSGSNSKMGLVSCSKVA